MKQEDRELLFKDLSARLPYGVKVQYNGSSIRLIQAIGIEGNEPYFKSKEVAGWLDVGSCKPYLRPIYSMTEEEEEYISQTFDATPWGTIVTYEIGINDPPEIGVDRMQNFIDWLLKNHFDFMGLIEKGLAIEVTDNNNPYKN